MIRNPSSFRDPSGYIFEQDSHIYRYVDKSYGPHLEKLTQSGLLKKLFDHELIISHEVVNLPDRNDQGFAILKPKRLPVITYPYEWSFSQLKEAAILTLEVLRQSLEHGMIIKDASAFNVQFIGYKPIFIDTLSFAIYEDGQPWQGYKQFCEHFLAPLSLSSFLGLEFSSLNRLGVDGIPLRIASKVLPLATWFKTAPLFHIHLHAKSVKYYSRAKPSTKLGPKPVSKRNLLAMVDHMESFIRGIKLKKSDKTQWGDYDNETHYSEASKLSKAAIVKEFVTQVSPSSVWDIGSNDGFFSRLIANDNLQVLSLDSDGRAVDKNYQTIKKAQNKNVYPLLFDLVNPSPDMGWGNEERIKLSNRSKPDLIIALAVIHHLVITNNIPFDKVANYLSTLSAYLIIEFVPPDDEKISFLPNTAGMKSYNRNAFDSSFLKVYDLIEERQIENSQRRLLLLRKKK